VTLRRRWLLWPVLVFVGTLAIHLVYLAPGGPTSHDAQPSMLAGDEGTVLYDSWRIARGQVMYRDFFEFQGPAFYYTYAALFAAFGPSIVAARAFHILVSAVASTLIALLVARFAGRWAGAAAAVIHACLFMPIWPYAYPHWHAEALALGGVALLTIEPQRRRWNIASGVLLALSTATIQSLGLPILLAAMLAVAVPAACVGAWKRAIVCSSEVAVGAIATVLVVLVFFAACGGLPALLYDTVTWPQTHYMTAQGDANSYAAHIDILEWDHRRQAQPWRALSIVGLHVIRAVPLLSFPAIAVAIRELRRGTSGTRRRPPPSPPAPLVVALSASAAVLPLVLVRTRSDLTHVAFVAGISLPAAALLFEPLRKRWTAAPRVVTALFLSVGAASFVSYAAKLVSTWRASRAEGTWNDVVQREAARVIERAAPGQSVVVATANAGYVYFVTKRPAGVSFTLIPTNPPSYYTEQQWRTIANDLVERRPVVLQMHPQQLKKLMELRPELANQYRNVSTDKDALVQLFELAPQAALAPP
jgi:hypothetical protein